MPRAPGIGSPGRAYGMRIARAEWGFPRRLEAGRLVAAAPDKSLVPRRYSFPVHEEGR